MDFEISVDGDLRLIRSLDNFTDRIQDWREAWPEVNKGFQALELDLFASGGATGEHGQWQELNDEYEQQRAKKYHQPFPFPLRRTLALEYSLTQSNAPNAYMEVSPENFARGSSLPYARVHMQRRGNRPARRPIDPTDDQLQKEILSPLKKEARRIAQREGFIVGRDDD